MKTRQHLSSDQAKVAHLEMLTEAVKSDSWMAVIWEIEDGKPKMHKTTWKFPSDAFDPALLGLAGHLGAEKAELDRKKDPPVPPPLNIGERFFKPGDLEIPSPPVGLGVVGGISGEPIAVPDRPENDDGKIRLKPMGEPSDEETAEQAGPVDGVEGGNEKADEGGGDGKPVREELPPVAEEAEEAEKPLGG